MTPETRKQLKDNQIDRAHTGFKCEMVLGNKKTVIAFHKFTTKFAPELELIQEYLFNEYWKGNEDISREQIAAYRQGLNNMVGFFNDTRKEINSQQEEEKEK